VLEIRSISHSFIHSRRPINSSPSERSRHILRKRESERERECVCVCVMPLVHICIRSPRTALKHAQLRPTNADSFICFHFVFFRKSFPPQPFFSSSGLTPQTPQTATDTSESISLFIFWLFLFFTFVGPVR